MAEAVGARGVTVTWLPFNISCITSIRVFFTPGGLSASLGIGATEYYTESGLTCNTSYTVTVSAIPAAGDKATGEGVSVIVGGMIFCSLAIEIGQSNGLCATGPRNFSASAVSSTSVRLIWEPPASDCDVGITGYHVTYEYSKCGMTGGNSSQILNPAELEYTFNGLEEDAEYVFTLVALRSGGTKVMTPISVRTLTAG